MKKIIILLAVCSIYILLNSKSLSTFIEKETMDIDAEEIAITFIDSNLLVSSKKGNNLLLLDNKSNSDYLSKFNLSTLDLTMINESPFVNFKYNNKYLLTSYLKINDVDYRINNSIISIKYADTTFCIYIDESSTDSNTRMCNFLYLYNTNNIKTINVDDMVDIIFLSDKSFVPIHFLEDVYSKWVDIYTFNKDEIVTIKISSNDYNVITIPNE